MTTEILLLDLSQYVNKHRHSESLDVLVNRWLDKQINKPQGGGLTPELLYTMSSTHKQWQDGQSLTPQPLANFIAQLTSIYSVRSILDPTCGSGLLLHAVANATGADIVHGIDVNNRAAKMAQSVLGSRAMIIQRDALAPHAKILDHYDLIIADAPLGLRITKALKLRGLGKKFQGEMGHALTMWACAHLNENGAAIVIMTPAFIWGRQSNKISKAIVTLGCRIKALIHLPGGTLPSTGIGCYLAVLERGEQKNIFVGEFKDGLVHQNQLIANIKRGKSGPQPALGRLCPLADFRGFKSFAAGERLRRLVKLSGWEGYTGNKVFSDHQILSDLSVNPLEHGPSSIYLRLVGQPLATLAQEELPGSGPRRNHNIIHLRVNPIYADPAYMIRWINSSQIGQATLESVSKETAVGRIDVTNLMDATLYLPSLKEQMLALDGATHLKRIRSVADELETSLWDGGDIDNIVHGITTINQEDRFEDWIETLPFPLASILWRHHAGGGSPRERYEVLLHFFEATAAFMANLHLSAFMAADELWIEYGKKLNEKLSNQRLSLDRATFGAWKLVAEYLAGACGKLLRSGDNSELLRRLYGTPNEKMLTVLSHPDIRSSLQKANRIRNDWSGHAGAISDDRADQIHNQLMELVYTLRGVFGRTWLNYELIQPGDGRFKSGIHHYKAKRLMGSRSAPFEEVQRKSIMPLESDSLYLFDRMSQTGLHLCPFVRVMPSPKKHANACFIFNRRESDGSRFVSYHFEEESSLTGVFPDVDKAFERLQLFNE